MNEGNKGKNDESKTNTEPSTTAIAENRKEAEAVNDAACCTIS